MTDGMPFRSPFERFDAACSDTPLANNGRGQAERSEGKVEINARMHRIEYLHDMTHLLYQVPIRTSGQVVTRISSLEQV